MEKMDQNRIDNIEKNIGSGIRITTMIIDLISLGIIPLFRLAKKRRAARKAREKIS